MTHRSPAFVELEPFPPESLLVRCAKGSSHLEGRMMVSNPKNWKWTSGGGSGGFEVRRRDWTKLREKMRRYTSFQWECKTIYVVCFRFTLSSTVPNIPCRKIYPIMHAPWPVFTLS